MNERTERKVLIVGAIVIALLSVVGGALIALSGDDGERANPGRTSTPSPAPSQGRSESPEVPETSSPSSSGSPVIEDGRHFVYVKEATGLQEGTTTVTFDLAYFLTGEAGEQAAADHDDEFVNGYFIVNDNPKLRTLPLADDVKVAYIPTDSCCDLQPGTIDAWLEAVLETNPTDYAGTDVPWWFTVEGGEITRIEQQYLP